MTARPSLTVAEVAEACNVSPKTVRALVRRGQLAGYKVAGRVRIDPADLERFLDGCRVRPQRPPAPARSSYVASTSGRGLRTLLRPDQGGTR